MKHVIVDMNHSEKMDELVEILENLNKDEVPVVDNTLIKLLPQVSMREICSDIYSIRDIIYYPQSFQYVSDRLKLNSLVTDIIYTWLVRTLEYNLEEQYQIVLQLIQRFKLPGKLILIRPYLVHQVDNKKLDQVRLETNIYDRELSAKKKGEIITDYDHPMPGNPGSYFGYRHAWHLLEYGTPEHKEKLLAHFLHKPDCTWSALIDWLLWKNDVPRAEWDKRDGDVDEKLSDILAPRKNQLLHLMLNPQSFGSYLV